MAEAFKLFVKSPIDVSHLGDVVGREFLLWVRQEDLLQRDRLVSQVLANRLGGFGDGSTVISDCDFDLMEVHQRKPLKLEGYHWDGVDQLMLDGEVLPEKGRYIFVPDAISTDGNVLQLRGSMTTYRLWENEVYGRTRPVSIKFGRIPEYKKAGVDIGCEVY